jgi:hypothetical protein
LTPAEHSELLDTITGWRTRAETGKGHLYPGQDLYGCADELEAFVARNAPTDAAELAPESEREARREQVTLPDREVSP